MGRKKHRHYEHRSYRNTENRGRSSGLSRRRRDGWGMNLYRNPRNGYIAGVCAGLAEHWDIEEWVVRLAAVVLLMFTGALAFWAYVAGWILLRPRPGKRRRERPDRTDDYRDEEGEGAVEMEYDERYRGYRPRRMFRYSDSAQVRLQRAGERLAAAQRRVEEMESYVTSRKYDLNKEFSRL